MNPVSVAAILELPVQERIHPQTLEVSPELKADLAVRLADFERNPEAGFSWDQVKSHLKSGSWRTA